MVLIEELRDDNMSAPCASVKNKFVPPRTWIEPGERLGNRENQDGRKRGKEGGKKGEMRSGRKDKDSSASVLPKKKKLYSKGPRCKRLGEMAHQTGFCSTSFLKPWWQEVLHSIL